MSDPAIKLFGRTITLLEIPEAESGLNARSSDAPFDDGIVRHRSCSSTSLAEGSDLNRVGAEQDSAKDRLEGITEGELDSSNEVVDPNGMKENSKAISLDDIAASTQTEEEQNESSVSQDKTPKKPDKILPCPRCNSLDTKFCYYNNYNVNQPRHFCKNCHRYWTAGGTIRNVAVGAGRRKNKNVDSQHRHLSVFETPQNGCKDLSNAIHPTLKPNGSLLPSCSDSPLCESMASVLNIAEKAVQDTKRNGFPGPEGLGVSRACRSTANGDSHHSGRSSITTGSSTVEIPQERLAENLVLDIPPHVACFPGGQWPYPRNAVTPLPPTAYCPAGFSMPLLPAAPYWGFSLPGTWNGPRLNSLPASQNETSQTSGPISPTLGKHSRDDRMMELANPEKDEPLKGNNTEKSLWVPKTLRIVDPEEAAKSSIWSTLGIKKDKVDSVGGVSKAFQSKGLDILDALEASPLLQANPSALSRSLSFQESSWDKPGEIVKPFSVARKRREPY